MNQSYYCPSYSKSAFNCPFCGVFADQRWSTISARGAIDSSLSDVHIFADSYIGNMAFSKCSHCDAIAIWVAQTLIYPKGRLVSTPNDDLPDDIKKDYEEAASILELSPRSAAALLRLCIQKLCVHLGLNERKSLNDNIGELVKRGLPKEIQEAMDLLRITGNNAVHVGEIDLDDTPEIASNMFDVLNFIAEKMITEPKMINDLFKNIVPDNDKAAIKTRDSKE